MFKYSILAYIDNSGNIFPSREYLLIGSGDLQMKVLFANHV